MESNKTPVVRWQRRRRRRSRHGGISNRRDSGVPADPYRSGSVRFSLCREGRCLYHMISDEPPGPFLPILQTLAHCTTLRGCLHLINLSPFQRISLVLEHNPTHAQPTPHHDAPQAHAHTLPPWHKQRQYRPDLTHASATTGPSPTMPSR